ncbi:BCCT family transporter [Peptostreptococcaceae bacterium AGR-M142]
MKGNISKILEEKLYSRNFKKYGLDLNLTVTLGSAFIIIAFSLFALFNLQEANIIFSRVKDGITSRFDWLFILASNFFILVCLFLAFSKFGRVRIGGIDSQPEFTNFAWYSMLLSAGMGIGLMFWAVGEPLYHSNITPPIFDSSSNTQQALATTFFHWGFHPWGIYALISLALAFFSYNKKLPLSLRSVFYPVLKDKIFGIYGDLIDILAVVACLFGLATSLGLGVQQINSGLDYLFDIGYSTNIQVVLIGIITIIATMSVVSGIDKGVKFLSELNIKMAFIFMLFVAIIGPTGYIIKSFSNSFGIYINDFIKSSFFISNNASNWQSNWSIFYLSWWISWSPFVGIFIARVSKGRTVREFVLAVLIVPSLLSFVWMSVFGSTSIFLNEASNGELFNIVQKNLPIALFEMIKYLNIPLIKGVLQTILSLLGTLLVISFFVTSSDSGSLVVDNITSGGKINTPIPQRIFWTVIEGVIATVLLLIGGNEALEALQTAVISTGLPFAIILIIMSFILLDSIRKTYTEQDDKIKKNYFEDMIKEFDIEIDNSL